MKYHDNAIRSGKMATHILFEYRFRNLRETEGDEG